MGELAVRSRARMLLRLRQAPRHGQTHPVKGAASPASSDVTAVPARQSGHSGRYACANSALHTVQIFGGMACFSTQGSGGVMHAPLSGVVSECGLGCDPRSLPGPGGWPSAAARIHHRGARRGGAAARRAGSRLPRRPENHHALRPGTHQFGPARHVYRRRVHRRSREVSSSLFLQVRPGRYQQDAARPQSRKPGT